MAPDIAEALAPVAHRKFSFRRERAETGLRAVASPHPNTHIKLGKLIVGSISAPSRFGHDNWRIMLIVRDPQDVAGWRWVTLRATFEDEASARAFLTSNEAAIRARYELATCGEDDGA